MRSYVELVIGIVRPTKKPILMLLSISRAPSPTPFVSQNSVSFLITFSLQKIATPQGPK